MEERYNLSSLIEELNRNHQEFYYLVEKEEEREYEVYRDKGIVIIGLYRKNIRDNGTRILARSVVLRQEKTATYNVIFFNSSCLPHLEDFRHPSDLLTLYVKKTPIWDDLEGDSHE